MTFATDLLSIEIFAEGADQDSICGLAANSQIKGFTKNFTSMRKAGITAKHCSLGRDLEELSLDTMRMFRRDAVNAVNAGYVL